MTNEPKTREEYRQQKEAEEAAFKQRDQERLRTEREYAREQQKEALKAVTEDEPETATRRTKKVDPPAVNWDYLWLNYYRLLDSFFPIEW